MNKDALLATLIGFGIGLLITGAFLFGPNIASGLPSISFKLPNFNFSKPQVQVSPIPTPATRVTSLTVTAPLTESLASEDEVLVSGTAPQGSTIVIAGAKNEEVLSANQGDTFVGKVVLVEGKNDIVVTAYIDQKEEISKLTVYYTPEDL